MLTTSATPERSPASSSLDSEGAAGPWHLRSPQETLEALSTSLSGLDADEVERRRDQYGLNELVDAGSKAPLRILWEQVTAVMVLILISAAVFSLLLGKFLEASAILVIVVLFAVLGFVQEYRAEKAIAALRSMASPVVRAMRAGRTTEIAATDLVPGDIVVLEAGNVVPADLRLVEANNLRIQEATLTGESEPVDKGVAALDATERDAALGDRRNLAYMGTQVTYGRAVGVVVNTGMRTELGHIAELIGGVEAEATPLQQRLDRVGKQLALGGLVVAVIVVVLGALGGESFGDLVLTAISVAVAVIPEGLPAVVTFTLAIGAQRMLKRQALIRKLPAVETLGSVTVICSDKTGTLTENRMTVTTIVTLDGTHELAPGPESAALRLALIGGSVCADAEVTLAPDGSVDHSIGDPTEVALLVAAVRRGLDPEHLARAIPRRAERPFDSERKRMSTAHDTEAVRAEAPGTWDDESAVVAFVKGAPDGLLARSRSVMTDHGVRELDDASRAVIQACNEELAANGMRVLAVAMRGLPDLDMTEAERDLVFLGLFGIIDPPRAEVRDAVATCRTAGIRPVMITGDHPLTAVAIAKDLGIALDDRVLTGVELEAMDDDELRDAAEQVSVFARVAPEHKLRIVAALQSRNHVVAMTGDGVNDAPALKRADIGVAMGITGTDVSKEASAMVLRDDNFSTIVAAVEEGRVIYDNLRRFVKFAVAGNIGKIIVMVAWPIPFLLAGTTDVNPAVALLPLQLLWLNLMTDGLLGLSMGVEPAEKTVMQRPPNAPGTSIWAGGLGSQAVWTGAIIGVASLAVGYAYQQADMDQWQTMMFTTLAVMQVFQAMGTRSATESLAAIGWRTNRLMLGIIALVLGLQALAVYTPLNGFLDLEPLGAIDVLITVGLGALLLVVLEAHKAFMRRRAQV